MRSHLLMVFFAAALGACTNSPDPAAKAASAAPAATLLGEWYWVGSSEPEGLVVAVDPQRYRLDFGDQAMVAVTADCNRGRASYEKRNSDFVPGPVGLSKMGCPPDSQDRVFLSQFGAAQSVLVGDSWLQLNFAERGAMHFTRAQDGSVRAYACANGTRLLAIFWGGGVRVLHGDKSYVLKRDGEVYRDGPVELRSTASDTTLIGVGAPLTCG